MQKTASHSIISQPLDLKVFPLHLPQCFLGFKWGETDDSFRVEHLTTLVPHLSMGGTFQRLNDSNFG